MKITYDRMFMGIVIIILSISLFKCSNDLKDKGLALELSRQTTDSLLNENKQLVYTQAVIVTNNQEEIRRYSDSVFNLTRKYERRIQEVISFYKGVSTTTIEKVLIPYIDSVKLKKWSDSVDKMCREVIEFYEKNTMVIPRTAIDSTQYYSANLTAERGGIIINNISIPDTQYVRFVVLKGGFLKKNQEGKRRLFLNKTIQVQVLHSNPLIKVTGQSSAIFKPPRKNKWLEKTILIGGGIFLGTQLFK